LRRSRFGAWGWSILGSARDEGLGGISGSGLAWGGATRPSALGSFPATGSFAVRTRRLKRFRLGPGTSIGRGHIRMREERQFGRVRVVHNARVRNYPEVDWRKLEGTGLAAGRIGRFRKRSGPEERSTTTGQYGGVKCLERAHVILNRSLGFHLGRPPGIACLQSAVQATNSPGHRRSSLPLFNGSGTVRLRRGGAKVSGKPGTLHN
jgi:hypothetical protein